MTSMPASQNETVISAGLALVVDDVEANRKILEALLKIEGYQTISAENGADAVQKFTDQHPDIVFMDAMMPVMNGYEATTRIKALAGTNFVPVIFLTALSEGEALVACIEAGGDEFLSKPFKQEILKAKVKAMQRIRDLSRTVAIQHLKIEKQHALMLKEQFIAEQIYNRVVTGDNISSQYIDFMLRAVSVFSGDLLLTAYSPDGRLYILLGDFTGHGLTAAVGVLPAAEVFRAMTAKGFEAPVILSSINTKLNRLLPTGMFMTACFVVIETDLKSVSIWNAGMPEVIILGSPPGLGLPSAVKHRVASTYLPLGILPEMDKELTPETLSIIAGDRILLCSDGVAESINADEEAFGNYRYEQVVTAHEHSVKAIISALETFCGDREFNDDISIVEVHCMPGLIKHELQ
jgi:CheY-like chemotaxis protein